MNAAGRSLALFLSWLLLALGVLVGLGAGFMTLVASAFLFVPDARMEIVRQGLLEGGEVQAIVGVDWAFPGIALFIWLACVLLFRLRKVIVAVGRGEPFHADNPRHLRTIALLLAAMAILRTGMKLLLMPATVAEDIDSWFVDALSVLVVFVLAEVFREGARLRAEAELTV